MLTLYCRTGTSVMPAVSMEVNTATAPDDVNADLAPDSPKPGSWQGAEKSVTSETSEANKLTTGGSWPATKLPVTSC